MQRRASLNFAGSWVTRGTPKSPPHSAAGYLFSQYTSSAPMAAIICQMPAAGTFAAPSSGPAAATSANETPDEVESIPSKWVPVAVHNHPTVASIATRQCLSSAARTSFKLDSSMFSESLSGSHTLLDTSVDAPTLRRRRRRVGATQASRRQSSSPKAGGESRAA